VKRAQDFSRVFEMQRVVVLWRFALIAAGKKW